MIKRLRLPSERELTAIQDHGLHEALLAKHAAEVRLALDGLESVVLEETITLDIATRALAGLLYTQAGIRGLIARVDALGTSALDEDELFTALARWVLDNQIGGGFDWDPAIVPARPTR